MLMNPPNSLGNVHGTFDGTSMVYSTGENDQTKAIVLVNFDPSVHLQGLNKWDHGKANASGTRTAHSTSRTPEATSAVSSKRPGSTSPPVIEEDGRDLIRTGKRAKKSFEESDRDVGWCRRESALYLSIGQGFDFGL